ncbi:hypothetical protein [Nitrosospira sp. Nsp18]|uniref:hypothetical protein n=1 Tax=Nitrosospira sp. Nsp18 TaxID=1855334 RepID=UPI00115FE187|nr:hypothetical protein [Nitrosospira sp. Nsp18]
MASKKICRENGTGEFKSEKETHKKEAHKAAKSSAGLKRSSAGSVNTRTIHSAPKKGSLSLSVIRDSVTGVFESRKK